MTAFAMFRKYNQRIYKRADSSYAKWLKDYESDEDYMIERTTSDKRTLEFVDQRKITYP